MLNEQDVAIALKFTTLTTVVANGSSTLMALLMCHELKKFRSCVRHANPLFGEWFYTRM